MSFNHSHNGVFCSNLHCALPRDTTFLVESPIRGNRLEDALRKLRGQSDLPIQFKDVFSNDKEEVEAAEVLLRVATGLKMDDHGKETPQRFVDMLKEMTTPPPIKWKTFPNDGMNEMIIERDIPFVSLCNHHVVPFIGVAHIGYIPDKTIAGLSKFARVVQHFAHALQLQERLTKQIADFLETELEPLGVAVVLEAEHLCMTIRGVKAPGAKTYTAVMLGRFSDHERTAKAEFMSRINGGH